MTGAVATLADPSINSGDAAGDTYSSVEGLHGDFLFYDRLYGNSGANFLFGGMLDDILSGGAGDDFLAGGEGRDRLFGGGDTDTASYAEAASAVTVDLSDFSRNAGDADGDSYNSIEIIEGSAFGDSLSGDAAASVPVGLAGDDGLAGAAGNDTLRGGQGADIFVFKAALDNAASRQDRQLLRGRRHDPARRQVFTALAAGPLAASAFKSLDLGPADADDRILYNPVTSNLACDADGSAPSRR